ncbi:GIY-YIG nuclease family protein [Halorarum halophilum]|uniref:GIY-YIG nuclease family protein n=1 Tax=Halorarum halophilum TaxID=2743090 RepID=A0A7D5GEE4_9EURY|nr:GIY-YIG nuclease family protein [Halobaculum halophilum]QLG26890.1 GIY-YIG nuclease family protein [Halobaculum halophilum]
MSDAVGGTYTLVLSVPEPITVTVGALGTRRFPDGGYAYTGSALGPGGFSRIDRHRRVAAGDHDVRHWHVDYLAGHDGVALVDVVRAVGRDVECRVADALADGPVEGFGASDCGCRSHLAAYNGVDAVRSAVRDAYSSL